MSKRQHLSHRGSFRHLIPFPGFLNGFFCLVLVTLCTGVLAFRRAPTEKSSFDSQSTPNVRLINHLLESDDSPQIQVMDDLLSTFRDLKFEELRNLRPEPRKLIDKLSFDPSAARYFDKIKTKLKLTDEELQLFRKNGFVSVDHQQRYSFGSAYYQIYSAHLPVFVTSDSILHALHRSFDDLLAELELSAIVPLLDSVLKETHESLVPEERTQGLEENFRDVDH
jgi:hypothetical protein